MKTFETHMEGTPVQNRPSYNIKVCCRFLTDNTKQTFETSEFEHKAPEIEFSFDEMLAKMREVKAFNDYCKTGGYPCHSMSLIATGNYLVEINGEFFVNKWIPALNEENAGTTPA